MKKPLLLFCVVWYLVLGCTKTKEVYINVPVADTVSVFKNKAWLLVGITVDGNNQKLSDAQLAYFMSFQSTGLFTDSYGITGNWKNDFKDSLVIIKNGALGQSVESYTIKVNDSLNLVLQYRNSSNQLVLNKYAALSSSSLSNATGGTPTSVVNNSWQLSGLIINDTAQQLSALQKNYKMTLSSNGKYFDSDGYSGVWNFPSSDSLRIYITNTQTPFEILYKINERTDTSLIVAGIYNGKKSVLKYKATTVSTVNVSRWQLRQILINGVSQGLTISQAAYTMVLLSNGLFSDSDGSAGTWSNPSQDSLKIEKANLVTPITLRYKINLQTANLLSLQTNSGTQYTITTYESQ